MDIKPKGFRCIEFDEYITEETITATKRILDNTDECKEMCEENFRIASKHYSFKTLRYKLAGLIANAFGPLYHWIPEEI